jgi:hypothetical protein
MKPSLRLALLLTIALAMPFSAWVAAPLTPADAAWTAISLENYNRLIGELSEDEGYFDTDNFISNEAGYLKVLPLLREQGIQGKVYIGVGPDQNYSYISEIRPALAIIVDIRRLNMLQHLYFKALFQLSSSRARFLERLFGRRIRGDFTDEEKASVEQLLSRIDAAPSDSHWGRNAVEEAVKVVKAWKLTLTAEDLNSIRYVARAFVDAGPDLRFSSYYRQPRQQYPTYRTLLLETDPNGVKSSYLASEERFRYVQSLHKKNLIIPVTGDLAGKSALRKVGLKLREWNLQVGCFYLSNVEFYLFGQARWSAYVQNMRLLPWSANAVLIRTCANSWRRHPAQIPGYYMTTLLQRVRVFFENENTGRNRTYWDLVTQDYIAP